MAAIKTLIIGLGNIGALYDVHDPSENTRTHLKALLNNPNFEVSALVDPDIEKHETIQNHFNLGGDCFYSNINEVSGKFDLAVFAAPPISRLENLKFVSELGVQFCVFEKPVDKDLSATNKIIEFCEEHSITALVNFHRRYDKGLNGFKDMLPNDEAPEKIVVHYTKGLKNYGSHAIDLILSYFGDADAVQASASSHDDDPLLDGTLYLKNGTLVHLISHKTDYDLFEFEFFYSHEKFSLICATTKQTKQVSTKDLLYKGYNSLNEPQELQKTNSIEGLPELYEDISLYFVNENHKLSGCHLSDAKKGMEIIENLIKSAADKRLIQL